MYDVTVPAIAIDELFQNKWSNVYIKFNAMQFWERISVMNTPTVTFEKSRLSSYQTVV